MVAGAGFEPATLDGPCAIYALLGAWMRPPGRGRPSVTFGPARRYWKVSDDRRRTRRKAPDRGRAAGPAPLRRALPDALRPGLRVFVAACGDTLRRAGPDRRGLSSGAGQPRPVRVARDSV